jgi:hypothetical protein
MAGQIEQSRETEAMTGIGRRIGCNHGLYKPTFVSLLKKRVNRAGECVRSLAGLGHSGPARKPNLVLNRPFSATLELAQGLKIIGLGDETLYFLGKFKPHFPVTRQCMVRNMLPHPFSMQKLHT